MTATTKARHRKATRALTPLSEVAPSARLGLAVAATSGLAIAMVGSGAAVAASTATEVGESAGSLEAGIGALAAPAREAVTVNEAVTVAADAQWQGSTVTEAVAEAAPAPKPKVTEEQPQAVAEVQRETPQRTERRETPANNPAPTVAPPATAGGVVAIAAQYLGIPYNYGASNPDRYAKDYGFDCSGLVQYVYKQAGVNLPRTSWAQGAAGTRISAAEAQPGDLVYYGGHIGIYAGNGQMIHASTSGNHVKLADVYGTPEYVRIG